MTGEIDRDFYCSADAYNSGYCNEGMGLFNNKCNPKCKNYHRKFPTPEQFKEEYGHEYPDEGAVYVRVWVTGTGYDEDTGKKIPEFWGNWTVMSWKYIQQYYVKDDLNMQVICACTPWGCPPAGLEAVK